MAQPLEDVAPARFVRTEPFTAVLLPALCIRSGPRLHLSAVERAVGGPHELVDAARGRRAGDAPDGGGEPSGAIGKAIEDTFGTFKEFQGKFNAVAMNHFGSGWAWLVTVGKRLVIYSLPNQDSPLIGGDTPVFGIDVWEHAYYLKYQNRRPEYIDAFWNVVNWDEVNRRYEEAAKRA